MISLTSLINANNIRTNNSILNPPFLFCFIQKLTTFFFYL